MDQIQKLKFDNGRLFKAITPMTKVEVYFRLITKNEYDNYIRMAPNREILNPEAEDYLLSKAVVYPAYTDLEGKLYAGEFHSIAEGIIVRSGFHQFEDFVKELKNCRLQTQTLIEQIMAFICKAFPIYTVNDLEQMRYSEIARLLALSESMIGQRLDIPGAEVPEPAQEGKKPLTPKVRTPDVKQMSQEEQDRVERTRQEALRTLKESRNRRPS